VDWGEGSKPWFSSLWWKDLSLIGSNLDANWLAQNVKRRLGNGASTRFWLDTWVGSSSLKDRFPRLYSISNQKEASVADLWGGVGVGSWNFNWRRPLFAWEEALMIDFLASIQVVLTDGVDKWSWAREPNGIFSVKSTYGLLAELLMERGSRSREEMAVFRAVWKCPAPSKVLGFAWLFLLDRIPSKSNLFRRNILHSVAEQTCVLCNNGVENSVHLFIYCTLAVRVWEEILGWLGLVFCLPHSPVSLFHCFMVEGGNKKRRQGMILIWCTVIWVIWRHRNRIIFENGTSDAAGIVEEIKNISWKWWISRSNSPPCLLNEWLQEPFLCILN
jgi:hypothetical protein